MKGNIFNHLPMKGCYSFIIASSSNKNSNKKIYSTAEKFERKTASKLQIVK